MHCACFKAYLMAVCCGGKLFITLALYIIPEEYYTVHVILCDAAMHQQLCIIYYIVYVHCVCALCMCIVYVHCALCTVHCVLCIVHCIL